MVYPYTRERTKQIQNIPTKKIIVENNVGGLRDLSLRKKIPKNAYTDVMNMVISESGGLKKRKTAFELGTTADVLDLRTYGLGYHESFGFIRVRGDKIETLADETATWVEIANGYNVDGKDFVQFVNFFATATTGGITKTIAEESELRVLQVNGMVENEYIGKLLKIGNEVKLIEGNTTNTIYISETFEGTYGTGTDIEIFDQVPAIYILSKGNDVKIWRGGTNIETLPFQIDKAVVQSYGGKGNNGRMFGIKNGEDKVFISEVGTGEFAPKDNFYPLGLQGKLQNISIINNRAVIYSEYGRVSITGDSVDSFRIVSSSTYKGLIAPGSVAEGNNIEFYLSHEGIEFLNSIETSTVMEGISMSDNIKKRFEKYTDFSGAMGVISNGKYYLSIQGEVLIYHLEKSVKNHKPIFTIAKYEECSDKVVANAQAYEWTFATEIHGKIFFGQGGKIYQITDEKIGAIQNQKKLKYSIEFAPHYMSDLRFIKAIKRFRLFIHNDPTNDTAQTKIKIYYKANDGVYILIRETTNIFEIEASVNKKINFGQIKVEFEDLVEPTDSEIEFHYSELEFIYFTKR